MTHELPWSFLDAYRGKMFSGEWPTLPELFRISAERFAGKPCFSSYSPSRLSLTYAESLDRIMIIAAHLRSLGVVKGSKVAVTGKNSPEWALAYMGALEAGATIVPIDYQLTTEEIANLLRASDSAVLFIDEEKATEVQNAYTGLLKAFSLYPEGPDYILDLLEIGKKQAQAEPIQCSDLAAILFTSGTTGKPKGVMLSHGNLVSDCFLAQANLHIRADDVFYALLPIHHSYTMLAVLIESLSVGAETVFGKKMIVKQILKDLKEAHVTMFLGVPLLFNKLLAGIMKGIREKGAFAFGLVGTLMAISGFIKKTLAINPGKKLFHSVLDKASLSTIRICISGGGPLAPAVFRKYNQLGIDFVQGYGLTETSPILTLNPVERYKETSVGKVIPGAEIRILESGDDGIGEIIVKGPMVMQGYYKMPEETKAVFTEDGWFKTGDLGYLDEENYLYLTGRAKNLIVTEGGKNVYPEEIENRFQLFPEIEQILIKGYLENKEVVSELIEALIYPEQDWLAKQDGDSEKAWKAAESHFDAIVEQVNQKLLPYQKITRVTLLEEPLEMTTTKKVKRFSTSVA